MPERAARIQRHAFAIALHEFFITAHHAPAVVREVLARDRMTRELRRLDARPIATLSVEAQVVFAQELAVEALPGNRCETETREVPVTL